MIIPVKKYLFVGVTEDLELFFKRAQKKGFIEFITSKQRARKELPPYLQKRLLALKILRKQPRVKQEKDVKDLEADKLCNLIIEAENCHEKLQEEKRLLQAEISRIRPLGDFSLKEIRNIEKEANRKIQFFCVKQSRAKKMAIPSELIFINTDYDMDYYMSISKRIESYAHMIEMHLEKSLSERLEEMQCVEETLKSCEKELKENGAYVDFLRADLINELNSYHLNSSKEKITSHMNETLFSVEGWIPKNRLHNLFPLLEGLAIHTEEVAVEKEDHIPTYMENKGFGKAGEDLVHIYDTPAIADKDPSAWVFWSFAIFFAMIISDAGYGLIFLILALFLRKKMAYARASIKRFLRLFTVISISVIVWGILVGSYFGLEIAPSSPINQSSLIHILALKKGAYHLENRDETYQEFVKNFPKLKEVTSSKDFIEGGKEILSDGQVKYRVYKEFRDSIFMEIALLVGIIHICLSLIKNGPFHYAGFGWCMAIIGGYLYFPDLLNSTSLVHFAFGMGKESAFGIGVQLLWVGIVVALLLSLIQYRLKGCMEMTKSIELFADILSYLRLYALGLAGMILAETFNEMGERVGFAAGFFIILIGHIINMIVGIMGGTIHGLRLNFIEWYHHCFTGGGRLFHPLKLLKVRGE